MTRAKYKSKSAKKSEGMNDLSFSFYGSAPGAFVTLAFDIKRQKIRAWPKILRQLADAIESGDLKKEAEAFLNQHATQVQVWRKK